MKSYLSYEAQILFLCIFKSASVRVKLKEVIESKFYYKHDNGKWNPNFVNTEKESPYVDPYVLKEI